jgi:cytochrome c biogenesis protein CcdA
MWKYFAHLKFSWRFYAGLASVVVSLVVGLITKITFVRYINNPIITTTSIIIYILSWPLLFVGIYWIGKDYADAVKKYFTYQFYHEKAKEGGKKAIHTTREVGKQVSKHMLNKTQLVSRQMKWKAQQHKRRKIYKQK